MGLRMEPGGTHSCYSLSWWSDDRCIWAFSGVRLTQIPEAGKTHPIPDATSRVCLVCRRRSSASGQRDERAPFLVLLGWKVASPTWLVTPVVGTRQVVEIGWWVHDSSSFCPMCCIKVEDISCGVWAIAWQPVCVRTVWTLSPRLHHKGRQASIGQGLTCLMAKLGREFWIHDWLVWLTDISKGKYKE